MLQRCADTSVTPLESVPVDPAVPSGGTGYLPHGHDRSESGGADALHLHFSSVSDSMQPDGGYRDADPLPPVRARPGTSRYSARPIRIPRGRGYTLLPTRVEDRRLAVLLLVPGRADPERRPNRTKCAQGQPAEWVSAHRLCAASRGIAPDGRIAHVAD